MNENKAILKRQWFLGQQNRVDILVNTWVGKEGGCPVDSWAQGAVCRRGSPGVYQAYEERHASNQRRPIEMTGEIQHYIMATLGSWVNAICWWRCEAMETLSLGGGVALCSLSGEQSGVLSGIMSARTLWSSNLSPVSVSGKSLLRSYSHYGVACITGELQATSVSITRE